MKKIFLFALCFFIYGCGHYEYTRDKSKAIIRTKDYTMFISDLETNYGLRIDNLSKYDLEIDWNKTSFIRQNTTDGGFMFEGIRYMDRNNYKNPTIILSKSSFYTNIYPNNLAYFSGGQYGSGWVNGKIPDGENGVYLVFKINAKEYREKLLIKRTTRWVRD